jgi:hypothetical protein
MEQRTGTQKADTGHDLGGNTGRILGRALQGKPLYRQDGEKARAYCDERIGSQASRMPAYAALQTHNRSQQGRQSDLNGCLPVK